MLLQLDIEIQNCYAMFVVTIIFSKTIIQVTMIYYVTQQFCII